MRAATRKWKKRTERANDPAFLRAYGITREQYVNRFREDKRDRIR